MNIYFFVANEIEKDVTRISTTLNVVHTLNLLTGRRC